jgi:cysteamine dioxygenase
MCGFNEFRLLVIMSFADKMKPEDVGLSPDLKFFRARDAAQGTPTITHTTIYKCPNFSVSMPSPAS